MARTFSAKRIAIDKANARLLTAVGIATFIVVFSLVASKSLFDQLRYQNKVISLKEEARDTLKENVKVAEELATSYQEFSGASPNIIGGNPTGDADRDGDNPRIVLDALPSQYDFPALATSIEKLLKDNGFTLTNITGNDEEVQQASASSDSRPAPIEIPFGVEIATSSNRGKGLVGLFERSIRPIQIQKLELSQQDNQLDVTITATTFFQPARSLDIAEEVVR